jgi:protein subunit release factor A
VDSLEEAGQDSGIDTGSITLECEAGAGGLESMIFNGELFEMYRMFCDHQKLQEVRQRMPCVKERQRLLAKCL